MGTGLTVDQDNFLYRLYITLSCKNISFWFYFKVNDCVNKIPVHQGLQDEQNVTEAVVQNYLNSHGTTFQAIRSQELDLEGSDPEDEMDIDSDHQSNNDGNSNPDPMEEDASSGDEMGSNDDEESNYDLYAEPSPAAPNPLEENASSDTSSKNSEMMTWNGIKVYWKEEAGEDAKQYIGWTSHEKDIDQVKEILRTPEGQEYSWKLKEYPEISIRKKNLWQTEYPTVSFFGGDDLYRDTSQDCRS